MLAEEPLEPVEHATTVPCVEMNCAATPLVIPGFIRRLSTGAQDLFTVNGRSLEEITTQLL